MCLIYKTSQDFHDNSVHMYILRLRNYPVKIFVNDNNNNNNNNTLAFSIFTGIVKKLLKATRNKKKTHNKIVMLARSKLNSIESKNLKR